MESKPIWKVPTGDLSDRQIAIMGFIKDYVEAHGWPPTTWDICHALRIRSTSTVARHLKTLARLGYIELGPGVARIRIIRERA